MPKSSKVVLCRCSPSCHSREGWGGSCPYSAKSGSEPQVGSADPLPGPSVVRRRCPAGLGCAPKHAPMGAEVRVEAGRSGPRRGGIRWSEKRRRSEGVPSRVQVRLRALPRLRSRIPPIATLTPPHSRQVYGAISMGPPFQASGTPPVSVLGRTRAPWASGRARSLARDLLAAWRGPVCRHVGWLGLLLYLAGNGRGGWATAFGQLGGRCGLVEAGAGYRQVRHLSVHGSGVAFPWEQDGGLKRLDAGRNGSMRAETVGVCAGRMITAGQGVEWGPVAGRSGTVRAVGPDL